MNIDSTDFVPRQFPITEARLELVKISTPPIIQWATQMDWGIIHQSLLKKTDTGTVISTKVLFEQFYSPWKTQFARWDTMNQPTFTSEIQKINIGSPDEPMMLRKSPASNHHNTFVYLPGSTEPIISVSETPIVRPDFTLYAAPVVDVKLSW